ncbi:MAG: hypothetical protein WCF67_04840 [Chitinophagaceae bacterium]
MAKITPIRTDLFRFVTLRTPQLISQEKKEFAFIHHPAPNKSVFLKGDNNSGDLQEVRAGIVQISRGFKGFRNYQEVIAISPEMYRFSSWLMKHRNDSTADNLKQQVQSAGSLKEQEVLTLWDNLMHQTVAKTSKHVRQACIQMIIANNFVEVMKKGRLKDLAEQLIETPRRPLAPTADERAQLLVRRLAKAKVVLPMAFSVARETDESNDAVKPGAHTGLVTSHESQVNISQVDNMVKVNTELKSIRPVSTSKESLSRKRGPGIPVSELKNNPLLKVSAATGSLIKALPASDKTVDDISTELSHEIRKLQSQGRPHRKKGRKILVSRGNIIHNKPDDLFNYTLSFRENELNALAEKKMPSSVYMTMNPGHKNAYVNAADYSLTLGDRVIKSNEVEVLSNNGDYMHVKLFPDQQIDIKDNTSGVLKGTLELDNGTKLSLDTPVNAKNKYTNSKAKTVTNPGVVPPPAPGPISPKVELYGVSNIGIGVLRKVEQEVCCYVPGEVSRIENIMAREYKERHTRSLVSTETTEETTVETETENLTDTATTDRNEMQTEVAQVLNDDNSTSMGGSLGVSGTAFGATVNADAYIDSTSSTSSSISDSAAKSYAEEITERTLERVVQKTTEKRTSRMLQEYEENNRHGFDNRTGDKHVTGVYRWIDIVYTNRLINYGKRLMYEFMLPEPAYFFKQTLDKLAEQAGAAASDTVVLEEPLSPAENEIMGPESFVEDTYLNFGRLYNVTIAAPPELIAPVTGSFAPITSPDGKDKSYDFDLPIPPDYEATSADVNFTLNYNFGTTEKKTEFRVTVGDKSHEVPKDRFKENNTGTGKDDLNGGFEPGFSSPWSPTLPIQVNCKNVHSFVVNVAANVSVKLSVMSAWQDKAYDQVVRAYEVQLAAYNDSLQKATEESEAVKDTESGKHESFNRKVEQREIQRLCIEMMTKPFGIKMGKNFYTDGNCVPSLKQTKALENYASHVKFFEQAFDWENMSYLFYPYYWAAKCDWINLLQSEYAPDPVFQAFLQSGMARVVAPVRPGFEDAVLYYMETGDIWNGGDLVMETGDDLYLSIAEELQEIEGFVEKEWQSRVPTSLTIVQGESVFLEDEGLPCCEHIENAESTTKLVSSNNVLSGAK